MTNSNNFFWIHIKKSAGQSLRQLLQPHYLLTDRKKGSEGFTESNYKFWNDILNNYRTPLGDLQYKRALFAARHLYPDKWSKLFSFAFVREPVSRCLSMYRYFQSEIKDEEEKFSTFLKLIKEPYDLRFATHTNPTWNDVTDDNDELCVSKVYRLDDMMPALQEVYEKCNLSFKKKEIFVNTTKEQKFIKIWLMLLNQKYKKFMKRTLYFIISFTVKFPNDTTNAC